MSPHFLTVDVEDWRQSTLDRGAAISERVVSNTRRLLDMLAGAGAHGTFFFLGLVAEKYPGLAREVESAGHEVASHGWSHHPVSQLGPSGFRGDLRRSLAAIRGALGHGILGYRAPDFSVTEDSFWALEILAEEGLKYDSSIFPFRGPRYGVAGAFRQPHAVRCRSDARFVEFPLTTIQALGLRLPVAGGGYFRLLPYRLTRAALRRVSRAGDPVVCYFHPYELDAAELHGSRTAVPWPLRLSQGLGRGRVPGRLRRLLREFAWEPLRNGLETGSLFRGRTLDLSGLPSRGPIWLAD